MTSSRRQTGRSMALGALLILVAQNPQTGAVNGIVTGPDGAPLPGVLITAESDAGVWTDYTDVAGHYKLDGLEPGSYEVRTELAGFCSEIRPDLPLAADETATVNLTMWLAAVNWDHRYVTQGLEDAFRLADVVVHLRVTASLEPRLWETSGNELVGITHEAVVIDTVKPARGPGDDILRFVQYPAGRSSDGTKTVCGSETPYLAGEEYVAFLERMDNTEHFGFLGPQFMIPVREGRIVGRWLNNFEVPGVREGMTVGSFLDVLRRIALEIVPTFAGSSLSRPSRSCE